MACRPSNPRAALLPLDWDTRHFGFPVAAIREPALDPEQLMETLRAARRDGLRLVYWVAAADQTVPAATLAEFGGLALGERLTYERPLDAALEAAPESRPAPQAIRDYGATTVSRELERLAVQAGHCSRFRRDPGFPPGAFESLYRVWIERSARGEIADAVLVADDLVRANGLAGMITYTVRDRLGVIGLIAVSEDARGQGLGPALMAAAAARMRSAGAQRARVATQSENAAARQLYERCGYLLAERAPTWHFWL